MVSGVAQLRNEMVPFTRPIAGAQVAPGLIATLPPHPHEPVA